MKLSWAALYNPTVAIAIFLITMIVMMVLPMPSWVLDIGLAASFSLAILIFMIVLFIERPLDFSSFPTVLLASLLLRLSLNVSSTKLIIGQGHTGIDAAGNVIAGFAQFIMSGNLLLGLVIFLVLMIVNFMVITKGAGRMAEVGARFALDAMPGKQLAIDADMAAGAISHKEAGARRKTEQEETTFYGSLDGVSKFVKGDAIAGLLITILNFFVGLAMGTIYYNMPIDTALQAYALLTVGDGLVTQIPAVVISVAAALLMAKGGAHGSADSALFQQFMSYPPAIFTVAVMMAMFAVVPGLPFLPFMMGAAGLAGLGWFAREQKEELKQKALKKTEEESKKDVKIEKTLGDHLEIDDIWVEFSPSLVPLIMDKSIGLVNRITAIRNTLAAELGFILPEIRLTDSMQLEGTQYIIRIHGSRVAGSSLKLGQCLVIKRDGVKIPFEIEETIEPVYGAPAFWLPENRQDEVQILGLPVASPNDVIATHLIETIKSNMRDLITRQAVQRILDEFSNVSNPRKSDENRKFINELMPDTFTIDILHQVLRALLEERVSVRNLPLIMEAIAQMRGQYHNIDLVSEHVRRRLSLQISTTLANEEGKLPIIQVSGNWEQIFQQYEMRDEQGQVVDIAIPPDEMKKLYETISNKLAAASTQGQYPVIAVNAARRRLIKAILDARGLNNPVIAFEEIHQRVKPSLLGVA